MEAKVKQPGKMNRMERRRKINKMWKMVMLHQDHNNNHKQNAHVINSLAHKQFETA